MSANLQNKSLRTYKLDYLSQVLFVIILSFLKMSSWLINILNDDNNNKNYTEINLIETEMKLNKRGCILLFNLL